MDFVKNKNETSVKFQIDENIVKMFGFIAIFGKIDVEKKKMKRLSASC